ncbi:MAG: hypothetical protein KatS3mg102_0081 [Planctomycetota bacterium]|nr:MAG: hypothetical protein KatS3mg102_0081 [Planctomycetota bacterium]
MSPRGEGLFDLELPPTVEAVVRKVEAIAGQPIAAQKVKGSLLGPCVGYFEDKSGTPVIEASGKPALEDVVLEVLRLALRGGRREQDMPYGELRHERNRALCARLYRIVEEEWLLPEAEAHGVAVRRHLTQRFDAELIEALGAGKYRKGEEEVLRTRLAALDGLELAVAAVDPATARWQVQRVGELDRTAARSMGFMLSVIDRYRPFESVEQMTAAYYVAVPFLFDTAANSAAPAGRKRR